MQLDITKPFLCLGRLGGSYLLVQATHRAYRVEINGKEDNSGDWLHTKVDIAAGGFRARYATHLHITDFARFRDELRELDSAVSRHETTNRAAAFRSARGTLRLSIEARQVELYTATCEATDKAETDALLLFTLTFDRADLTDILRSLDLMLAEFPANAPASV